MKGNYEKSAFMCMGTDQNTGLTKKLTASQHLGPGSIRTETMTPLSPCEDDGYHR